VKKGFPERARGGETAQKKKRKREKGGEPNDPVATGKKRGRVALTQEDCGKGERGGLDDSVLTTGVKKERRNRCFLYTR